METSKRNRANTTERILTAFEQVVSQQGIEGLSITGLAEKADVSKVLIYRYFGNLDGLIDYYVKSGRVLPQLTPAMLTQIRPTQEKDIGTFWSTQALKAFGQLRASASARQLLKASAQAHDPLCDTVSQALDQELTHLVQQLSLVQGSDHEGLSAVVLGGLSYLTIQAQLDRSVLGMDLRKEADWERIEKAVKLIYQALANMAFESPVVRVEPKSDNVQFKMR